MFYAEFGVDSRILTVPVYIKLFHSFVDSGFFGDFTFLKTSVISRHLDLFIEFLIVYILSLVFLY